LTARLHSFQYVKERFNLATVNKGVGMRRQYGFTLIELMIVVVVVAILAAIAYPSYQSFVMKSRRGAAQAFMGQVALKQEEFLSARSTFAGSVTNLPSASTPGLGMVVPAEVAPYYTFAIDLTTPAGGYTVTGTAQGVQLADGDLTLNSAGSKTPAGKW
jgi:type IV pilus assembly protein PilE